MDYIEYLQSPQLVVKFQQYFGIEKLHNDGMNKDLSKSCEDDKSCHLSQTSGSCPSLFDKLWGNQMVGGSEVLNDDTTQLQDYRITNRLEIIMVLL